MKPPIQIVNDQDELIDHKVRGTLDYTKDIYRVSALWLTNSKHEVLIAKRTSSKDRDPGLWGPAVAGTLDEGEDYDSNIKKETQEEIGLKNIEFFKGPKIRVTHPRNYFCQWYFAETNKPANKFTLQEDEVDSVKWVSPEELLEDSKKHPEKYVSTMPTILINLGTAPLKDRILDFMKTQHFTVISTSSKKGEPESALIGFSETPELEMTFGTSNKSRKYKNLMENPKVAFVIGFGEPRITIQYEGLAKAFQPGHFEETGKNHLKKLPDSSKYVGKPDQVWFKVTPTWIRYTDSRTEHTAVYEMTEFV